MTDLLLITPPFTQLNTPYPATAYLKGFLRTKGISAYQMDLGIETILGLFSKEGLRGAFDLAQEKKRIKGSNIQRIFALRDHYIGTIEETMAFLQGRNPSLARSICSENFLPQASRFEEAQDLEWAFGTMGMQDKAKHMATLYLEDLSDFIVATIDPHFGFSRYAERLGRSANTFDELHQHLQQAPGYIEEISLRILQERIETVKPRMVGFAVPFPGNLFSAFRCAQWIKEHHPQCQTVMGGGFPNTELRSLSDPRVFAYFDFITLDDGELPLELLVEHNKNKENQAFKRTFLLENGEVVYKNNSDRKDYKQQEVGTPDYSDLLLDRYISVIEVTNPMHSLWSDGRWNKLTMAHGCYWGKCTFCDISLDYIKLYEPLTARLLVDRMEELIAQTGERGFHFVDEAAPPALMKELALEIIRRKLNVTWWTNIRFEKSFTRDLCQLLQASGCVAVSGGLEVASDRLLQLIQKGVTVEQVAQVTRHFSEAGIMVHAYLMYGYPTQTVQETVDSLEMVRQLFEAGVLQSGFWHQFALTAHSPVGLDPQAFGVLPQRKTVQFAENDLEFSDSTGIDHSQFSFGLKKSLFNYMHGLGFDMPLQEWFEQRIPKTQIPRHYIAQCLQKGENAITKPNAKIVWLGRSPEVLPSTNKKEAKPHLMLRFHDKREQVDLSLEAPKAEWLVAFLESVQVHQKNTLTLEQMQAQYEEHFENFPIFWYGKTISKLREIGLLAL